MAEKVNITSGGIQKVLRNYNEKQALAEYIWNGFDAKATVVEINYSQNELGFIEWLEVSDNGYGIDFERLAVKFDPFYESEKALQLAIHKNRSAMHGKNGVGRLTFFRFAHDAEWRTTYLQGEQFQSASIRIGVASLNSYQAARLDTPLRDSTGTRVIFSNLKIKSDQLEQEIIPFLKSEFSWFLELNKISHFQILINGVVLDYSDLIQDYEENLVFNYADSNTSFKLKFVQWKASQHKELSKVYFLNEKGEELHKEYTTLNKKADDYFHSVYVTSEFFNEFDFSGSEFDHQPSLYSRAKSSAEYKFLSKKINELLLAKRKQFLKDDSSRFIDRYQREGVLGIVAGAHVDPARRAKLLDSLRSLYEAQPKLFSNLSIDQKKTIINLLDAVLCANQPEQLLNIFSNIVEFEEGERQQLLESLG